MAESRPQSHYLPQLDGLRGLAIVLVIINHLRLDPFFDFFPSTFHPILFTIVASGKTGVGMLFLLSGFLMASLYATVPNPWSFWQKRYTRIFPSFVAMCLALAFIRFGWSTLPAVLVPAIVMAVVYGAGKFWQKIQDSPHRVGLGKALFFGFFGFQVLTAIGYFLIVKYVPAAVFYQLWPSWLQMLLTWAVNTTMTLPFGQYVAQLDGVYWSLVTEVLFYLLYPILILPIMTYIKQTKGVVWSLASLIAAFGFFYGISMAFAQLWGLSILIIHLALYFVIGAAIGLAHDSSFITSLKNLGRRLPGWAVVGFSLFAIFAAPIVNSFLHLSTIADHYLWMPFIAVMFIFLLEGSHRWSKILQNTTLIWLGQLSFALYLTHTIAIEVLVRYYVPRTVEDALVFAVRSVILTLILAMWVHNYLEKPYLTNKIKKAASLNSQSPSAEIKREVSVISKTQYLLLVTVLAVIGLSSLWLAFQTPAALATKTQNHTAEVDSNKLLLTDKPLLLPFTAAENNLGMIFVSLKPLNDEAIRNRQLLRGSQGDASLIATLYDDQNQVVNQTSYALYQIQESPFHPIGLPLQPNSAGKNYTLALNISVPDALSLIELDTNTTTLRSVYFYNKKQILTQPKLAISLVASKIAQPFSEFETQKALATMTPLILILLVASVL